MKATWTATKEVYHFNYMLNRYTEQEHLHALAEDIMRHERISYIDAMQRATAIYNYHMQMRSGYMPNRNARYHLQQQSDEGYVYQPG